MEFILEELCKIALVMLCLSERHMAVVTYHHLLHIVIAVASDIYPY